MTRSDTPTNTRRRPVAAASQRATERSPRTGWIVAVVIAAVLAVGALVAVLVTGSDSEPATGIEQVRPVTITGTPLPAFTDGTSDPAVGMPAPALAGAGFDATPITVEAGSPTLLVFLAHWCPHCQREVPVLTEWAAAGGVPDGIDIVGVATSTTPDRPNYPPSEWLEREGFPFPVLADSATYDAATAFGLTSYPYFVYLDAAGNVVFRASGEIDPATLTEMLTELG